MTSQQIGDDSSIMEFSVDGEYHYEGDTIRFSYPEQRLTGLRGTQTNVVISPDEVTIDRKGYINSRSSSVRAKRITSPIKRPTAIC